MLSLQKIAPADRRSDVTEFMGVTFPGVAVWTMAKLDGISCSLVYRDGVLKRVATRGDGVVGEDVTTVVRHVARGIPAQLSEHAPVEVRGELVMTRSALAAYNASGPKRPLANPRNAAAGVVGLKDPEDAAGRELMFVAFDLDVDAVNVADERLDERLAALGFTPAVMTLCKTVDDALAAIAGIEDLRRDGDMDIDGAVLRVADVGVFERAGARSTTVRGAVAVKFAPQEGVTTLLDVAWPVGTGGKLPPRAVLEPVLVAGTTISSATLSTPKVVRERGLMIGMRVTICRRGDVIPYVQGPAAGAQPDDLVEIVPPTHCPSCGDPVVVQGESAELYCVNLQCPAQGARRLVHWASRVAADIDAVGPVWIGRLYDAGVLRRPQDFYTLDEATLLAFDGMAVTLARKMLASIEASKRLGLRRCLIGLGIRNAREGTAKRLCHAGYVDLHAVAAATVDELQAVPDIGLVVATSIYETMRREDTAATIGALQAAGVNLAVLDEDRPVAAAGDAPLNGVVAVVTGAITDPATGAKVVRSDFERGVAGLGATIASSVSAKTGLLVCGANVGASKTAAAARHGVVVVDQADIWALLHGTDPSPALTQMLGVAGGAPPAASTGDSAPSLF